MVANLTKLRQEARALLDLSAPRDGLPAYYALYHDPARTELYVEREDGSPAGFLSICQTGRDLFRRTAVLRARQPRTAQRLLQRGLKPRRPYYLITTLELQSVVEQALEIEESETNRVYRLDMSRYSPKINVLVTLSRTDDDSVRFIIRSQDKVAAESGINWQSPHFAEIYVWTAPQARGRGWGKSVVESCANWLIRSGVRPLYIVSEDNVPSIRLAESVGFVDTHAREFAAEGMSSSKL